MLLRRALAVPAARHCSPIVFTAFSSHALIFTRCASTTANPHRALHTSAAVGSLTGVTFSQVPPAELKIAQWQKSQEIAGRRTLAHQLAKRIWSEHPNEVWSQLTLQRSEELLRASGDPTPGEWDINEFLNFTLQTHAPWAYEKMQRERKAVFEQCLAKLMREIRAESDAYRHGTMLMNKNELTRRLTKALGRMPLPQEVEDAWQDRHTIPAIDWVEDAI